MLKLSKTMGKKTVKFNKNVILEQNNDFVNNTQELLDQSASMRLIQKMILLNNTTVLSVKRHSYVQQIVPILE